MSLTEEKPLRRKDLAEIFNVCPHTIDKWVRLGKLVEPFYLGTRTPRWRQQDIALLLATKAGGKHPAEAEVLRLRDVLARIAHSSRTKTGMKELARGALYVSPKTGELNGCTNHSQTESRVAT